MTRDERRSLYQKWAELINEIDLLNKAKKQAEIDANAAFEQLKSVDIERAYEAGDRAGWGKCDEYQAEVAKKEVEAQQLYKLMNDNLFPNLEDFESCGQIGHSVKKKLEVTFLDGSVAVGYIYPWEGDYCGPPYYFIIDGLSGTIDIDEGWNIYDVNLLE